MNKRRLRALVIVLTTISVFTPAIMRNAFATERGQVANAHIIKEIRHELATLPYYGVFDWLEFEVRPDNTVVLKGQVVRPTTKSDAEARVKGVDGVAGVINAFTLR